MPSFSQIFGAAFALAAPAVFAYAADLFSAFHQIIAALQ